MNRSLGLIKSAFVGLTMFHITIEMHDNICQVSVRKVRQIRTYAPITMRDENACVNHCMQALNTGAEPTSYLRMAAGPAILQWLSV